MGSESKPVVNEVVDEIVDEATADKNNEEKIRKITTDKRKNYYLQLKIAKDTMLNKSIGDAAVKIGIPWERPKKNKCVCEERIRAFMRMLRVGEGTPTEDGYTTAFGGKKITDLSKHPEEDYGGSSAAGAYQIMRYTYWWLNGQKLNGKEKAGVYEEWHDYIKKYNIPDYRQESQDKLCIIIMKYKRPGLLDLIKKGEIEKAIRSIASYEWASLPHEGDNSYYTFKGKPQPATPMKKCLELFDTFFKEELAGTSDLHLKKGFLKEFLESCKCGGKNKDSASIIRIVRKWEYDSGDNSTSSTVGTFTIDNDTLTGYILEPLGPSTTERDQDKRIPAGEYSLTWRTSGHFPKNKYNDRYLDNGFPNIYNEDVAKGRGILIHRGCTGIDTTGCLLPGTNITVSTINNKKIVTGVTDSTTTFNKLIDIIEKQGIDNVKIIITENYEDYK